MKAEINKMSDPFALLDATAQGDLVRRREVRPIELVDAAIARIERLNGDLNAVTAACFDAARAQARAQEASPVLKGRFPGVPYLVKDLSRLQGLPITFGSRMFANMQAASNEAVVDAALDAGLIPLGKTNTPEFGLLPSTEPSLFGPTRNPWSLTHSPGGSSGGAAAAVASGMTPIASGGDGGGSLRIPASCCGLVGLKPSRGRAHDPVRQTPGTLSVSLGLSRTVRDTAALLAVQELPDGERAFPRLGMVAGPSARRLRIALAPEAVGGGGPSPEVAEALMAAAALCAELGHEVVEAAPEIDGQEAIERFLVFWGGVPHQLLRALPLIRLQQLFKGNLMLTSSTAGLEPWSQGLAAWYRRRTREEGGATAISLDFFEQARRAYAAFFDRYDVILSPVLRRPPPKIGELAPTLPFETLLERCVDTVAYTPIHNAIGTPAISLPLWWSPGGLPIGSQFAARAGDERTLLELAYELEAALPWAQRWPPHAAVPSSASLA